MRKQVLESHACRDPFITQAEIGQIGADGRVEIDFAHLPQHHQRRGGEGLADRSDLKERVGRHGQGILDAGHAKPGDLLDPGVPHANCQSGNGEALHAGSDFFTQTLWPGIRDFFTNLPQAVYDAFSQLWDWVKKPFVEAWDAVSGWFADTLWPGIKTFFLFWS